MKYLDMDVITNSDAVLGEKDIRPQYIIEQLKYHAELAAEETNDKIGRCDKIEVQNEVLRSKLSEYESLCTRLEADRSRLMQRMSKCTCEMLEAENIQLKLDLDAEVAAKMGVEEDLNSKLNIAQTNLVNQVQLQNQRILQLEDEKQDLQIQNTVLRNISLWQVLKQRMCGGRRREHYPRT
uniref:uncharacterized protein LOC120336347 n=1 Tax=Styela clava TaxID=7725 RepID=UPI0019394A6B|nr:uncharacterized protein LOC120336347 [Styela clava]